MIIKYLDQVIDTGDDSASKHYYTFGSQVGVVFSPSTGGATLPGTLVFDGNVMKYYDSKRWIVLRDISDQIRNLIDKRNAVHIGEGDYKPAVDMPYPLLNFHRSVVDGNGVYYPATMTSKYLTLDNALTPVWKQWTLNSWAGGGDPSSVWGGRINFHVTHVFWGGNNTWDGYIKFSKGWNVGFANNGLRVANVKNPIADSDASNRQYANLAANTIATSTAASINSSSVDALHNQLTSMFNAAKADSNGNRLRIFKTIVQRYG